MRRICVFSKFHYDRTSKSIFETHLEVALCDRLKGTKLTSQAGQSLKATQDLFLHLKSNNHVRSKNVGEGVVFQLLLIVEILCEEREKIACHGSVSSIMRGGREFKVTYSALNLLNWVASSVSRFEGVVGLQHGQLLSLDEQ